MGTQLYTAGLCLLVACVLPGSRAAAQAVGDSPGSELASVRIRYGLVLRDGSQNDAGPDFDYFGLTPNDLALRANVSFGGPFGLSAAIHREGFSLYSGAESVVTGSLLRAHLGPTARLALGPVELEALVGYGFSQIPDFGSSVAPTWQPLVRHAALTGARLQLELPFRLRLELRGEYPLALLVQGGPPDAVLSGITAGAAMGLPVFRWRQGAVRALLDGELIRDQVHTEGTRRSIQRLWRAGLGLEVVWGRSPALVDPPTPVPGPPRVEVQPEAAPRQGSLLLRVMAQESSAPVPAFVELEGKRYPVSADGSLLLPELPPGTFELTIHAEGHRIGEVVVSVVAGGQTEAAVELTPLQEPALARISGLVRSTRGGRPLAARLELPEADIRTHASAEGGFVLSLPAGTYQVIISAPGHLTQSKEVTLKEGDQAIFNVDLHPRRR